MRAILILWVMIMTVTSNNGHAADAATTASQAVDFATRKHMGAWLRHPVYGDASFDTFARAAGNPLLRGTPPLEWPVNGFLFEDPVSRDWFVYAGEYAFGYVAEPGKESRCTVFRSADRGKSWQRLGGIFGTEPFTFDGDSDPVGYAPDVSVVYDGGKYHLVYDYATAHATWPTMTEPVAGQSNGIGYAWAERPEGPYHRTSRPVYRVNDHPWYRGKYRRAYAQTLIRREHDWLVLAMMDSGPDFSWALVGMTAGRPEGPWSEPVFLRCLDDDYFHPPLLEFFPAFTRDGFIYAPATSVALNRNYQGVFRARVEDAMRPAAWEVWQAGSAWHADDVENEHFGIWGQTFSGMVTADGVLHAMFPSRDKAGLGTINLAARPWAEPYRERGFTLTGHQGPSLTLLQRSYKAFKLEAELRLTHGRAAIVWGWCAPLGPDRVAADATLHPLSLTDHRALELGGGEWRLAEYEEKTSHSSTRDRLDLARPVRLTIEQAGDGRVSIGVDGKPVWSGQMNPAEGPLGLLVEKDSHLEVTRFAVDGQRVPARFTYLPTEAILGAGAAREWRMVDAPTQFGAGVGAVSLKPGARAKWNVPGTGEAGQEKSVPVTFSLNAPRGPEYGQGELLVDGERAATLDFHADMAQASAAVWRSRPFPSGPHAVTLRTVAGTIPLDTLEVEDSAL